jgi:DNA-directed RNA polymerase subunit L
MSITIDNIQRSSSNTVTFDIHGTPENGFDKSQVNAIRRTLLSSIPSVGFSLEGDKTNLTMIRNDSSLHNEFILNRIALVPLYINPETYQKQYLFYLNVQSTDKESVTTITMNDFSIYPIKDGVNVEELNPIPSKDNYQMNNPLSQEEKDKILRPFIMNDTKNYCILTELKKSSDKNSLHIEAYGVPDIGHAYENSRWCAVSQASYMFKKDEEQFKKVLQDKIAVKGIQNESKDVKKRFAEELFIKESERYFLRDNFAEPYHYEMTIQSTHYMSSEELFVKANDIIRDQINDFKKTIPSLFSGNETMSIQKTKENVYVITCHGYDHTVSNLLQSYISRYMIDNDSEFAVCGYKKVHPLQDIIEFTLSFNTSNKIFSASEAQKNNAIIKLFDESCSSLLLTFTSIIDKASATLL